MSTDPKAVDVLAVVPEPVDVVQAAIDLGKEALSHCLCGDTINRLTPNQAWESMQVARDATLAMHDEINALRAALARIRDFDGDPRTPVHNSVQMAGIARAALARCGGAS